MGKYSKKDMVKFAKFTKSWQTPKDVDDAYREYLKGKKLIGENKKIKENEKER